MSADTRMSLPLELERKRKISVKEAAKLKGVSESTFKRRFKHLIEQLSERRRGCELGKVLDA